MNLLNYIEEENLDENNESLKYLNDISSNLLQIFEDKNIISNLGTNVKFFMWSNSARSVKEGVYINHFKFSDTLGGYSLRYQEPTPRGRGKEVGTN